ncbi:MAG: cation transporter [Clostridia bacterium]|nr:cation transporter [Clostridia bacterium]
MDSRQAQISKVSAVGIAANVVLVIFKAVIGMIIGSIAIVTDALNNLADAFSSVVTMIGAKLAAKAPDRKHPYGYGQIEYLSSMAIGMLILYTGVSSFVDSFEKILHPELARYDTAAIVIIVAGIAVKILLGRYFKKRGREIGSEALTASGADASLDALVSSSILVGAAVTLLWNVSIDGWIGIGIALLILKSGIDVIRDSVSHIIGERIPAEEAKELKAEIEAHPRVLGAYDLILNRYGPELTIGSVHIQVPDEMTAPEIDALSREISGPLFTDHNIVMTVGIYAANEKTPEARKILKRVHELTAKNEDVLQVHGFYVDEVNRQVSFDLVLDFNTTDREKIRENLRSTLEKEFPGYSFSIVEDADFSD